MLDEGCDMWDNPCIQFNQYLLDKIFSVCKDESDRRVVIFENVLPADMHNPWFYTALLRCKRVIMEFPLSAGKIDADFSHLYG